MSDGGVTYSDACLMDWEEILEGNAALDILEAARPKPKGKGAKK